MFERDESRLSRWYFGGVSATLAVTVIYPIDIIKVGVETEQELEQISVFRYLNYIRQTTGLRTLYRGLTYSMQTQLISSTIRFGAYAKFKQQMEVTDVPFIWDVALSTVSGVLGGFVRTPIDTINTRMQADLKLQPIQRRNYQSMVKALKFIHLLGGYSALFSGANITMTRSALLTIGQICFYEEAKQQLQLMDDFGDEFKTHICASCCSAVAATLMTQPFDVLRSRYLVSTEDFRSIWDVVLKQMALGFMGFYRGSLLTLMKLGPQTVITFVVMEQLRLYFGFLPRCHLEYEPPPPFWTRLYRKIMRKKPPPPVEICDD